MILLRLAYLLPLCLVWGVIGSISRELMADWSVSIGTVSSQSFEFDTGAGGGDNPNVKILVYDLCRTESRHRGLVGELFPDSTIGGIKVDKSGIQANPGPDNVIAFSFVEGAIAENAAIYTDNGDKTASVVFCAEVGLYDDEALINFKEVKLSYEIDLITNFVTLAGDE